MKNPGYCFGCGLKTARGYVRRARGSCGDLSFVFRPERVPAGKQKEARIHLGAFSKQAAPMELENGLGMMVARVPCGVRRLEEEEEEEEDS